jgi:hypothetical protein
VTGAAAGAEGAAGADEPGAGPGGRAMAKGEAVDARPNIVRLDE